MTMKKVTATDTMVAMVETSVENMAWLKDSDVAAAALAFKYAKAIDDTFALAASEDLEARVAGLGLSLKALNLGPHLMNTLKALGGTPADRKALAEGGQVGGKLSSLRAKRAQREAAAAAEAEGAAAAG